MKYFLLICVVSTTSLLCKEQEYKSSKDFKQEGKEHYNKGTLVAIGTAVAAAGIAEGAATLNPVMVVGSSIGVIVAGNETIHEFKEGYRCNKEARKRERIERDVERQIEAQEGTSNYQGESSFCDSSRGQ